jgi:hypothetical protein
LQGDADEAPVVVADDNPWTTPSDEALDPDESDDSTVARIRESLTEANRKAESHAEDAFADDYLHSELSADWQEALELARAERNRPVEKIDEEESPWKPQPGLNSGFADDSRETDDDEDER